MGRTHGVTALEINQYNVLGLVETNPEQVKLFNKDYKDALCFLKLSDALETLNPDIVVLSVGVHVNAHYIQQSFKNGAHVFVEKPLTLNCAEYRKIKRMGEYYCRYLKVGYILREHPAYQRYLSKIEECFYRINFNWKINLIQYQSLEKWKAYKLKVRSPLIDCCVHYIDLFLKVCQDLGLTISLLKKTEEENHHFYRGSIELENSNQSIFCFSLTVYLDFNQKSEFLSVVGNENQELILRSKKRVVNFEHEIVLKKNNRVLEKNYIKNEPDRIALNKLQHLKFLHEIDSFDKGILPNFDRERILVSLIE